MREAGIALSLWIAASVALLGLPAVASAAAGDQTSTGVTGETLALSAGIATNSSLPLPSSSGELAGQDSLIVETPGGLGESPANVTLDVNQSSLWQWPASLGETNSFSAGSTLTADNGSTSSSLVVPEGASVRAGSVAISTPGAPLSNDYSLALRAGSSSVLALSGAERYLTPSPLQQTGVSAAITSVATGEEPNGTLLVAEGTEAGWLYLFDMVPGGGVVYSRSINLGYDSPVTATLIDTFPYSPGAESVVAASGPLLFVLNQTTRGVWSEQSIKVSFNVATAPVVTGLAVAEYKNGFPAILVATDVGTLEISNFTYIGAAGGWASPLLPLATLPSPCSVSLASAIGATGSNLIAVGCASEISLFNLTSTSYSPVAGWAVGSATTVDSLALNESGTSVAVGTSTGAIYTAQSPWTSGPVFGVQASDWPVVALVSSESGSTESLLAESSNGSVLLFPDLWSSDLSGTMSTISGGASIGTLGVAGVFGSEDDIYFASGTELEVARSVSTFSSTLVGAPWVSAVSQAVNTSASSSDVYGNRVVIVPVVLSVEGGELQAHSPLIVYNNSWTIALPGRDLVQSPGTGGSSSSSVTVPFTLRCTTGGQFHIELVVSYSQPASSSWWSNLWNSLSAGITHDGIYLAVAAAAAGGAFLVLGELGYFSRSKMRRQAVPPSPATPPSPRPGASRPKAKA